MSELLTLARPYAEAVFKRAVESKTSAKWSDMLSFLSIVVEDKKMTDVIANPKVGNDQLTQLFLEICQDQFSEEGINFVKLMILNDRLTLAPQVSELFESFKAEQEGYIDVEIVSAYGTTKEEQKKFATMLKKILKKEIHITTSTDKDLIGGFLAKAGDKVIDGSVRGQLQQLAKTI